MGHGVVTDRRLLLIPIAAMLATLLVVGAIEAAGGIAEWRIAADRKRRLKKYREAWNDGHQPDAGPVPAVALFPRSRP